MFSLEVLFLKLGTDAMLGLGTVLGLDAHRQPVGGSTGSWHGWLGVVLPSTTKGRHVDRRGANL